MARLLVIHRPGNERHGEVVCVKPDDHVWGRKEVPPRFELIDMPGVDPARLMDLIEPDLDPLNDDAFIARKKLKITNIDEAKTAVDGGRNANQRETALRTMIGAYN